MTRKKVKSQNLSPHVADILDLLARGALLSSLFLFPGAALGFKAIFDVYEKTKNEQEYKKWERYNLPRLRFVLQRIHEQKLVETSIENNFAVVKLTRKGQMRLLKYQILKMKLEKPKSWDKKWRMIIYDISKFKRKQQDAFRRMLKKLEMLPLQKSVYLTPYSCEDEIEFLRQYLDIGNGVLYLTVESIENEKQYLRYFGLD